MNSNLSVYSNKEARSSNKNTAFYTNNQQLNNEVSLDVESRFGPKTNFAFDSLPMDELIAFHKNRSHKRIKYMILTFVIVALIGLAVLIPSFFFIRCMNKNTNCSTTFIFLVIFGSTTIAVGILGSIVGGCCGFYELKRQLNEINVIGNEQQSIIWRLDGEEWIRYLNYIYGPDRKWREADPLSCFCCRHSSYNRLMNRQYGYIVLYGNGLIIDELYFISFRQFSLEGIQLLTGDEYQRIIGLRIYTYLNAGKNSRNCSFDVFPPSSITLQQLQMIAQSYNQKISDFSRLGLAINGLPFAATALYTSK